MAQSLNRCEFIGRLTKDPEMRYTTDGKAKTSFTLAVDGYKEKVAFPRCISWGKLAEICGEYLTKGKQVHVAGRYEERTWTNDQGVKQYAHEFNLETMQMLGTKEKSESEETHDDEHAAAASPEPEDDIPF